MALSLQGRGRFASMACKMLRRIGASVMMGCLCCWANAETVQDDTIIDMGEPLPGETAVPDPVAEAKATVKKEPAEAPAPDAKVQAAEAVKPLMIDTVAGEDDHVLSQSGLFSVSGGDSLRMGAIATRADDLHGRLCAMLDKESNWKFNISIRLLGAHTDAPRLNPVRMRIRIIGQQPNFQIRIYPGGGINLPMLDNAIITMVLNEQALRDLEPEAYPESINLPDWLVTGVQQALLWKSGQADREVYRSLYNRAEMMPPEEIISLEQPWKLDAATRRVFDVSCGVLMLSLLESPGGCSQLNALLSEVALDEDAPLEIIKRYFHELGVDENMLNKWWALELAAMSEQRVSEALTPLESEQQLVEALTIVYFDEETQTPQSVSMDNVYALTELPEWKVRVQGNLQRLVKLNNFCFPGYRPVVQEYCRLLADLLNGGNVDEAQNRLGPLRELREAYVVATRRGRDYLDWYEITHMGLKDTRSFDSYLEAMNMLRRDEAGVATHMSRYLEDVETLYHLEEGQPLPQRMMREWSKRKTEQSAADAPEKES